MDEISNGNLVGTLFGNLTGDVALVPGKLNKALYTNGMDQWVNIGDHRDRCLGNLEKCSNGFVMALWLKAHTQVMNGSEYYVNSGGHTVRSIGMTLLQQDGKLVSSFRTTSMRWRVDVPGFVSKLWYHVVLVWSRERGERIYLNGCMCGGMDTGVEIDNNKHPWYTDFIFGNANTDLTERYSVVAGEMTLDEVRVWDVYMEEKGVWELFTADILLWFEHICGYPYQCDENMIPHRQIFTK